VEVYRQSAFANETTLCTKSTTLLIMLESKKEHEIPMD